ncbi:protein N-terminal asparagine amidohydrolase [Pelobates fuscus]|uniref:protein N-terminal asparagine amidohydrolase n=1 Tax=Pelobates fuscus TaxID=191477 RepID=UPI002FE45493
MPLLIGSQRLDVSLSAARIVQVHPELEVRAKALTSQPIHTFGPKGFLYVQQRELAVTTSNDSAISILGSDDATTCHIVVLRHTGSEATCLAHCDGSDTESEVADILYAVQSLSQNTKEGRLELHLIGGFIDKRRLSQKLSSQLLKAFDRQTDDIYLITFCVSELNDKEDKGIHLPIIYGIAVNVKTAEIFRANCQDRHPDEDLRSAYTFTGGTMLSIYDPKKEQLKIGPYSWIPFPNIDFWLEQEDEQILECFSTSPLAEPPHFVAHIRSTLHFLKENPQPTKSIFTDRKPRVYRKRVDGTWERVLTEMV